jgi:hypothetical protein
MFPLRLEPGTYGIQIKKLTVKATRLDFREHGNESLVS